MPLDDWYSVIAEKRHGPALNTNEQGVLIGELT